MSLGKAHLLVGSTLLTIVTAVTAGMLGPQELDWLPNRFEKPVLAIELARLPSAFRKLMEENDRTWPHMTAAETYHRNTLADFAFIAAYTSMWTLVLMRRSGLVCRAAIGFVIAAAVADVIEDVFILRGLSSSGATAGSVTAFSIVKWAALVPAFIGLAYSFWPSDRVRNGWQLWSIAIALMYGYAAVLCAVGVMFSNPVIERVGLPISLALVMQLVYFWQEPSSDPRVTSVDLA